MSTEKPKIGFLVSTLHHILRSQINNLVRDEDLTKPQFDCLVFIHKCEKRGQRVIQRDLENYFRISNPSVSSMLNRLEGKELIRREFSADDRRIRYVVLTPKALEQIGKVDSMLNDAEKKMLSGLSEQELSEGRAFLEKILCNLTGKEEADFDFNTCKTD